GAGPVPDHDFNAGMGTQVDQLAATVRTLLKRIQYDPNSSTDSSPGLDCPLTRNRRSRSRPQPSKVCSNIESCGQGPVPAMMLTARGRFGPAATPGGRQRDAGTPDRTAGLTRRGPYGSPRRRPACTSPTSWPRWASPAAGRPLVMLRLAEVTVDRLRELVTDAWRMRAPAALAAELDD